MDFRFDDLDIDGALARRARGPGSRGRRSSAAGWAARWRRSRSSLRPRPGRNHDVVILNFALVLEYLQSSFYTEAERIGGAAREDRGAAAERVGGVERAHVDAFKGLLGRKAVKRPASTSSGVTEKPKAVSEDGGRVRGSRGGRLQGPGPPHHVASGARGGTLAFTPSRRAMRPGCASCSASIRRSIAFDDAAVKARRPAGRRRDELHHRRARPPRPAGDRATPDDRAPARRRGAGRRAALCRGGACAAAARRRRRRRRTRGPAGAPAAGPRRARAARPR